MAYTDGVDYVVMPRWRIFLIQLLNIAGLGPIFGAVMGVLYGPAALLWIVFGCIFGGMVHDYFSGMISLRHKGENLPEILGRYLGSQAQWISRAACIVFSVLVGWYSPWGLRHSGPDDGVERLHMGMDHLRLLLSGYHSAHPGHHGAGVPPVFRSADHHGGRHSGRDAADALCGIHAVLDAHSPHGGAAGHGLFPQPPPGGLPAVPGHVHHDCLRSRERLPRHPVPPDGPLPENGKGRPARLRRSP